MVHTPEDLQEHLREANSATKLQIAIPGVFATWEPSSGYKPACLLDSCRFRVDMPPAALKKECSIPA